MYPPSRSFGAAVESNHVSSYPACVQTIAAFPKLPNFESFLWPCRNRTDRECEKLRFVFRRFLCNSRSKEALCHRYSRKPRWRNKAFYEKIIQTRFKLFSRTDWNYVVNNVIVVSIWVLREFACRSRSVANPWLVSCRKERARWRIRLARLAGHHYLCCQEFVDTLL